MKLLLVAKTMDKRRGGLPPQAPYAPITLHLDWG